MNRLLAFGLICASCLSFDSADARPRRRVQYSGRCWTPPLGLPIRYCAIDLWHDPDNEGYAWVTLIECDEATLCEPATPYWDYLKVDEVVCPDECTDGCLYYESLRKMGVTGKRFGEREPAGWQRLSATADAFVHLKEIHERIPKTARTRSEFDVDRDGQRDPITITPRGSIAITVPESFRVDLVRCVGNDEVPTNQSIDVVGFTAFIKMENLGAPLHPNGRKDRDMKLGFERDQAPDDSLRHVRGWKVHDYMIRACLTINGITAEYAIATKTKIED